MTPISVNGKVVYVSDILKLLEMTDDEWNEEYRDLVAADIGEEIENPFASLPNLDDEADFVYPPPPDLGEITDLEE